MQLVRLIAVGVAVLIVAGGYLQEMRRLAVIKRLPGLEARDYYERTRIRTERVLTVVSGALAALAITAAVWAFGLER